MNPAASKRQHDGRVAIVTGSNVGLGVELARMLAENGANLTIGNFSTMDPDASNSFTYTLVAGTGLHQTLVGGLAQKPIQRLGDQGFLLVDELAHERISPISVLPISQPAHSCAGANQQQRYFKSCSVSALTMRGKS